MITEYFVVLIQYDIGLEAVVEPALTRAEIVTRIKTREYNDIVQIDHIHSDTTRGGAYQRIATDVTEELIDEAEAMLAEPFAADEQLGLPASVLPSVR
jgi:hypothetical protein